MWAALERGERKLLKQSVNGKVYVVTGTYYVAGEEMCKLPYAKIENRVPNGFWKIIILQEEGKVGYASFVFSQNSKGDDFCKFRTSLRDLKKLTKLPKLVSSELRKNNNEFVLEKLGCTKR